MFKLLTGQELAKWLRSSSMSEQFSIIEEQEDPELGESPIDMMPCDMTRFSIMSNDSGIERDLPPSTEPSQLPSLDAVSMTGPWEQSKK